MSSPISTSSRQAPVAPKRTAPQARPQKEVHRPQSDRLELGRSLPASLIEADVRLSMVGGPQLAADGTVTIQRTFIDRLVRHALAGSKEIKDARIGFDAESGSYTVQAKVVVKGLQVPLSLQVAPVVDQNRIGFQFREVAIPTRFGSLALDIVKRKVTEAIAGELRTSGFDTSIDARRGVVRLDMNSLLGQLGALPSFARLDFQKTRLSMNVAANGNIEVGMHSAQRAPQMTDTRASDISVFADAQALQKALRSALGPDYEVANVTLNNGSLRLDGKAEFKEGSDFVTGAKALLLLLAVASGDPAAARISPERERMMIPLALDIKQEGTRLVITPSLSKALDSLIESVKKAGLDPVVEGKSIRIDLNDVWKGKDASFEDIRVQPEGTSARMRLDLDTFLNPPWLKNDVAL